MILLTNVWPWDCHPLTFPILRVTLTYDQRYTVLTKWCSSPVVAFILLATEDKLVKPFIKEQDCAENRKIWLKRIGLPSEVLCISMLFEGSLPCL